MLSNLHIENIAVIESADIDFNEGFCVLTGETGAGKSIIIDAINMILGNRTSKEIIRHGAKSAFVSGSFYNFSENVYGMLLENGIPCDDDQIIISREVTLDGKNSCRINGRIVNTVLLKDLGKFLINIHGQHDNQSLLSSESHIDFLDSYAKIDNELNDYHILFDEYKDLVRRLESLNENESEKKRKIDMYNYQIDEISAADLHIGEEEELQKRKIKFKRFDSIKQNIQNAYVSLYGDDELQGAYDLLSNAMNSLSELSDISSEYNELYEKCSELYYLCEDVSEIVREEKDNLEDNFDNIDEIESRLDIIYRLKMKYGDSIEKILEYCEKIQNELDIIVFSDEKKKELADDIKSVESKLEILALDISKKRKAAGERLSKDIENELSFLEMDKTKFAVSVEQLKDDNGKYIFTSQGIDSVEFLLSANVGEDLKPLSKIASGGELSRIMLGIKTILSSIDDVDTLIFDEIDTGISGRAAEKVGKKIMDISKSHQVLCVTHLAQIARFADNHYLISKSVKEGRTYTKVDLLDFDGRKNELARIMGGINITDNILNTAEELLLDKDN